MFDLLDARVRLFEPGDVDLQVEVADVADDGVVLHLLACARPRMMSRQPVAVTKMSPREAASSIVVTS